MTTTTKNTNTTTATKTTPTKTNTIHHTTKSSQETAIGYAIKRAEAKNKAKGKK